MLMWLLLPTFSPRSIHAFRGLAADHPPPFRPGASTTGAHHHAPGGRMRALVLRARTDLVRREAEVASPPALPAALAQFLLSTPDVQSVDRLDLTAPRGTSPGWAALADQVAAVQC